MDLDISESSCRVCLNKNASYNVYSCGRNVVVPYSDILSDMLSLKICQDDGLPQKVCKKCTSKLVSAYELKCLAYESYTKLLEFTKSEVFEQKIKRETEVSLNVDESNTFLEVKKEDLEDGITSFGFMELDEINVSNDEDQDDNKPLIHSVNSTRIKERKLKVTGSENVKRKRVRIRIRKVKEKKPKESKTVRTVCDLCGKLVRDVEKHAMTHSEKKKQFPCADCDKVFLCITARRRHRDVHHLGKLYYCEICKAEFKYRWQHIRFKHSTAPRPFSCILCNKSFFTSGQLNYHMKFHTKERPHKCEVCGKGFISSTERNCHRRSVHEKERTVMCQYCPKRFFSNPDLKKHLKSHTGEKDYKCKECGKAFLRNSGLKIHMKRHRGQKDITCEICFKTFYQAGNLKVHMITHTKEKKYECKYCGVKFGRTHHRDRHQKTAHENKMLNT